MFHYVYSISYAGEPNIYFGVRSSRKPPEQDTGYWGSPATFKAWMDAHKASRVKTILSIYDTREEAELAEDELIEHQWAIAKPLSLNGGINGTKFNVVGREKTQKQKEAVRKAQTGRKRTPEQIEALTKSFYLVSPSGQVFQGVNLQQFCRDNDLDRRNLWSVIQGKKFHYKGWTSSLAAHRLYLEFYTDRGISWHKGDRRWQVSWYEGKNQKVKYFKNKSDAIAFRDSLVDAGYEFRVNPVGWKNDLTNK